MAVNSVFAVHDAYDNGRFHQQRFIKTGNGQANDYRWQDWAFQAGQPAYDARIGASNKLTQVVAVGNDAIHFPAIPAGMERKLHRVMVRPLASGISQAAINFALYDLVAYYPLIDGDSTDPQDMDNTLPLPRYADGEGLRLVMVNHVAPAAQAGTMIMEYTDSAGVDKTLTIAVPLHGINMVCSGASSYVVGSLSNLNIPINGTGIRAVNRVTYTTPPGGLHCLYVIKPLAQFTHFHDALVQGLFEKHAIEVDFAIKDGGRMPVIKDGAHLGFFYENLAGGRATTFFGQADFIWG